MPPSKPPTRIDYSSSPLWSNITPTPLSENSSANTSSTTPLASIAYPPHYSTAMSYLRAVMQANEFSERALALTADVIEMNPAHYTVWLFRARIVRELAVGEGEGEGGERSGIKGGVERELKWLEGVSRRSLKNYQIWHHRQTLLTLLPPSSSPPAKEQAFLSSILALDSKNYHVWTYRQWFVSHFNLFDNAAEMAAVEGLLREDVRNNSAWNHRWFLVFGRQERESRGKGAGGERRSGLVLDEEVVEREISFAKDAIEQAPQNQSPWNYLRGVLRISGRPLKEVRDFAEAFLGPGEGKAEVAMDLEENVRSSHALDLLAEVYAEEDREKAKMVLEALGRKWDPIRKGYWDYRIRLLGSGGEGQSGN